MHTFRAYVVATVFCCIQPFSGAASADVYDDYAAASSAVQTAHDSWQYEENFWTTLAGLFDNRPNGSFVGEDVDGISDEDASLYLELWRDALYWNVGAIGDSDMENSCINMASADLEQALQSLSSGDPMGEMFASIYIADAYSQLDSAANAHGEFVYSLGVVSNDFGGIDAILRKYNWFFNND